MLEVPSVNVEKPSFKATSPQTYTPRAQFQPMDRDTFMLMQAQKKADSKDKWMKAGVIAGVACAVAFIFQAMTGHAVGKFQKEALKEAANASKAQAKYFANAAENKTNKRTAEQVKNAAEALEKSFKDLSEDKSIVGINDPSLPPEFRKWAEEVIANINMPSAVTDIFGKEGVPNMIYMYGGSGTGKTYNANVLFKALNAKCLDKQFSNFSSEYIGKTSVNITEFFEELEQVLKNHPEQRFGISLNEFETLAKNIEKMGPNESHLEQNRTAMLNGLDMIRKYKNVFIVASSNVGPKSGKIDGAIARRFSTNIEIPYPTEIALGASLKTHLSKIKSVVDRNGQNYFDAEKDKIEKFVKELHRRKGGHGDVETIVETAVAKSKKALLDELLAKGAIKKTEQGAYETVNQELANQIRDKFRFETKYLEEALAEKGQLAGEMGNEFTHAA